MQQEHNMITFRKGNFKFTFRVAAVIIRDGHVLLQHAVQQWHPLDKLAAAPLYPSFLQEALKSLPEGTEHIVHVDR
jgi:hypothetical protein